MVTGEQETFFKAVQQSIIIEQGDEEELEYDSDGNPIIPDRAKVGWSCDPLWFNYVILSGDKSSTTNWPLRGNYLLFKHQ